MGQYYNIIVKPLSDAEIHAYDRTIDGEYTAAKLMEHSWYLNPMVNAISEKIYHNPSQIAWVGDYYDDGGLSSYAYPKDGKYCELHKTEFTLNGRFLVNHTKMLMIDCWDYLRECMIENENGWVPHPLPLLTALGNGRGGGDYRGINEDKVGSWAWDVLEIVDWEDVGELEKEGYRKFKVRFECE